MKEYQFGNTTVIVHSPLWSMTEDQQAQWIKEETKKGNKTLECIRQAIKDCYRKHD